MDLWRCLLGVPRLAYVDIGHLLEIFDLNYDLFVVGKQSIRIAPRFHGRL